MFWPEALASGRFFFHLVLDGEVIRDEQGIMLSIQDGVLLCAARALEELRQEGFFASGGWQGGQIEVADGAGRTVLRFSLGDRDLLHWGATFPRRRYRTMRIAPLEDQWCTPILLLLLMSGGAQKVRLKPRSVIWTSVRAAAMPRTVVRPSFPTIEALALRLLLGLLIVKVHGTDPEHNSEPHLNIPPRMVLASDQQIPGRAISGCASAMVVR